VGSQPAIAAWKLPLIVAAIAFSIVAGFYIGGDGLGLAVGALAAAAVVYMAARNPPRYESVPAPAIDSRERVLIVLESALEDRGARIVAEIVGAAESDGEPPEVLLASPCRSSFLERWTSDLEPGRLRAPADLVHSSSVLAKAEVPATARVGDEEVVQMTEDVLRRFAATEVVLVSRHPSGPNAGELEERLTIPLHRIDGGSPAAVEQRPLSRAYRSSG
jgi:hypothetical protein